MHHCLQGATFHIEHVLPRSVGGSDDASNLALAYPSCNLYKSDKTKVFLPPTTQLIALFNPRLDTWSDHFEWNEYELVGKTSVGEVTVAALHLNDERRKKIRQAEHLFDLFPPV